MSPGETLHATLDPPRASRPRRLSILDYSWKKKKKKTILREIAHKTFQASQRSCGKRINAILKEIYTIFKDNSKRRVERGENVRNDSQDNYSSKIASCLDNLQRRKFNRTVTIFSPNRRNIVVVVVERISSRSIALDYDGISVMGDFYFASHCFSGNNQEHPRKGRRRARGGGPFISIPIGIFF